MSQQHPSSKIIAEESSDDEIDDDMSEVYHQRVAEYSLSLPEDKAAF